MMEQNDHLPLRALVGVEWLAMEEAQRLLLPLFYPNLYYHLYLLSYFPTFNLFSNSTSAICHTF